MKSLETPVGASQFDDDSPVRREFDSDEFDSLEDSDELDTVVDQDDQAYFGDELDEPETALASRWSHVVLLAVAFLAGGGALAATIYTGEWDAFSCQANADCRGNKVCIHSRCALPEVMDRWVHAPRVAEGETCDAPNTVIHNRCVVPEIWAQTETEAWASTFEAEGACALTFTDQVRRPTGACESEVREVEEDIEIRGDLYETIADVQRAHIRSTVINNVPRLAICEESRAPAEDDIALRYYVLGIAPDCPLSIDLDANGTGSYRGLTLQREGRFLDFRAEGALVRNNDNCNGWSVEYSCTASAPLDGPYY